MGVRTVFVSQSELRPVCKKGDSVSTTANKGLSVTY